MLLGLANGCLGALYAGTETCAGCHQEQFEEWRGSHHDWAMAAATEETVLGDFDDASYSHQGVTSTFKRKHGEYYVNTQAASGKYEDFRIDYTFGVEPLQQYLISYAGGRLQALTIAWDSRPKEQSGQRWYQLMPDDLGEPGESLHWTGAYYNWNSRCAECHSTGLEKNYSMATNTYATTFAEINVACESCHGPGSNHVSWAKAPKMSQDNGLEIQYSAQLSWAIAEGASTAIPSGEPHQGATTEIESCAGCHSRRSKTTQDPINNHSGASTYLDHYNLQLLEEGLYHADGQIQDEVYVYGSFLQSKMHQRGVKCSNCHNPHSLELKAQGNQLCAGCHAAVTYDTPKHHFHVSPNSDGAQCVSCHMPATLYMGVDSRRDHRIAIPRPDLTGPIGAPNACNSCHVDKTAEWSSSAINQWLGKKAHALEPVSRALYAGRNQQPDADQRLIELANNGTANDMARATALRMLQNYPALKSYDTARQQLLSAKPLLRMGALNMLAFLPLNDRWELISPALKDPVGAVRNEATRLLLGIPGLSEEDQRLLDANTGKFIAALMVSADMPMGQISLAAVYLGQGKPAKAEKAYRHALILDSKAVGAWLNLADLYRSQRQEGSALSTLSDAQVLLPDSAVVSYSLGLAQVRNQQWIKALASLKDAVRLAPQDVRYSYAYALILNGQGAAVQALEVLKAALVESPSNYDLLFVSVTINRDLGQLAIARSLAKRLVASFPRDANAGQLLNSL